MDNKTIRQIVDDYRATKEALRMPVVPRVLGIDEAMVGGVYRAVITNVETNDFFELLEGRTKPHLDAYFAPLADKHKVEIVVSDLWNNYRIMAKTHFPHAPVIADRFHVMRMASNAVEALRKSIRKTLSGKANEPERLKLKDRRWLLLRRQDELDAAELVLLAEVKTQYPLLGLAHDAKEGFFAVYDAPGRATAEALYAQWKKAGIDPQVAGWFKSMVYSVDNWHKEVFNFFDMRYTNAYTESFNRFIKDTNRFGRGYDFPVLRSRLLYNNIAKHIEWPRIRPKGNGQGAARAPVTAPIVAPPSAGSWGFTDAFMAPPVRRQRAIEVPTTEELVESPTYLWYGASIPIICDLLEQGYFERPPD